VTPYLKLYEAWNSCAALGGKGFEGPRGERAIRLGHYPELPGA
jgi:hypothetical protein